MKKSNSALSRSGNRIALLVEGDTERAFLPHLRRFLGTQLAGNMPKMDPVPYVRGLLPKGDRLRDTVEKLLSAKRNPADYVIALTDVYTGSQPPTFVNAADARAKMREWVGDEPRFYPHAAQYDFEAWLLPYWPTIQNLAKHNMAAPAKSPEAVNHGNPPSKRIKKLFEVGKCSRSYSKVRDGERILRSNNLGTAISQCPELKSFVNTILTICGANPIP